jgi:hypothetical protein
VFDRDLNKTGGKFNDDSKERAKKKFDTKSDDKDVSRVMQASRKVGGAKKGDGGGEGRYRDSDRRDRDGSREVRDCAVKDRYSSRIVSDDSTRRELPPMHANFAGHRKERESGTEYNRKERERSVDDKLNAGRFRGKDHDSLRRQKTSDLRTEQRKESDRIDERT